MSKELEKMVGKAFYKSFLEKFLNIFPCVDWRMPTEEEQDESIKDIHSQLTELFIFEHNALMSLSNMEKKQPKRDKNGRFMKKENKKAFDYEGAYKEQKEVIAELTKESQYYKTLAERLSADYLEACAKLGHVKSDLKAYETYWPKLKKIAKYHRRRSNKLHDVNVILIDALREAAIEMDWLRDRIPFYKMPFLRKKLHEWDEYFDSLCNKAEGLDRE